jgi:hypothetical protein
MSKPYFHNAKKEDAVYDLAFGAGVIIDVNRDKDESYCWLKALFPANGSHLIYNLEGGGHGRTNRTLFYEDDYKKYIQPAIEKATKAMRRGLMFSMEYQLETWIKFELQRSVDEKPIVLGEVTFNYNSKTGLFEFPPRIHWDKFIELATIEYMETAELKLNRIYKNEAPIPEKKTKRLV